MWSGERVPLVESVGGVGRDVTPGPASGLVLGTCVEAAHPVLSGRVRVRVDADAAWLPTLRGLAVREGDRVLLGPVQGCDEPVVLGVLDGTRPAARPAPASGGVLRLLADEVLTVCASDGAPLLHVAPGEGGPSVVLAGEGLHLSVAGPLELDVEALRVRAAHGGVCMQADGDVVLRGETIRLN